MKLYLSILLCLCIATSACVKNDTGDTQSCENIKAAKITPIAPVAIGEEIDINITEVGGYRIYTWSGPDNFTSQEPENNIPYATLANEGWYYVSISNSDCETKYDSVYVDVKLQQENPPCTAPANAATYSNLFDDSFTSVDKGIESTYSLLQLEGDGSADRLSVLFHPYWRDAEPEDGVYYTTNVPSFSQTDGIYNKLFVNTTKQSIYWSSTEGQKVYVSHVSGKLKVSMCNLAMGGYNGTSYSTAVTASMTEK